MGVENNIPEGWIETSIGNLVELAQGVAINAKTNHVLSDKDNGLPLLKINNLLNDTIDQYANPELVPEKSIINKNDVIFTRTGQVGKVLINKYGILHNNSFKVIPNEKLYWNYLYWYLKSNRVYNYVQKVAAGSVQMDLNHSAFKTIEIKYPTNIDEQKAIAKVLTVFDDKIELLQAQNKTLESIAQTIFKEWFGKYQIGDELPEGWSVGDIYNVLDVQYGYPFKSKLFNENKEGLPLIRIRDIRKGVTGFYTTEAYEKEYLISSGDVLAGMDAVFQPYLWSGGKGLLNQRACRFIPKDFVSRIFVFEFMKPHLSFYEKTKVGTTVIHLGKGDLDFIETVIPDKESLLKFKDLTTPIEEKIINNQQEIQSLIKTRDTLLPKLMSGQVRVNNIKQTANA
jgi:type I restriction enzyme S subunit